MVKARWVLAVFMLAACDPGRTLHPSDRDTTSPASLYSSKANLETARLSAIGDFQIAYAGSADEGGNSHEGQINMTGMFVDELTNEETFPTRIQLDDASRSPSTRRSAASISICKRRVSRPSGRIRRIRSSTR
jgi:hypothetical protein